MSFQRTAAARLQQLLQKEIPHTMHPVLLAALAAILLLGVDLRVQSVLRTTVLFPVRADARDYVAYAYNLRHFGVYTRSLAAIRHPGAELKPDALRSPGYPLFLTAFMAHLPDAASVRRILMAQAFLSVLVIAIGYALFRHYLDPPWAIAAAGLTAVSPHLVTSNVYLLSESLFTFLLVSGIWVLLAAQRRDLRILYAVAGAILGAATLTRPGLQYFVPLLAVAVYWQGRGGRGLANAAPLLAGFALVLLPWPIRNVLAIGATSDPTLMINFLHHGMYPGFMYHGDPHSLGFPYRFDPRAEEISRSVGSVLREILRRFRSEPWTELSWYVVGKPVAFWSWNIVAGMGDVFVYPVAATPYTYLPDFRITHLLMYLIHWPLVASGLAGMALVWWPRFTRGWPMAAVQAARACSLLLIYSMAIHMVGAPFPRYSIPLRPFLFALAMVPWVWASRYVTGTLAARRPADPGGQSPA